MVLLIELPCAPPFRSHPTTNPRVPLLSRLCEGWDVNCSYRHAHWPQGYQRTQKFHFIPFSCYRRQPFLKSETAKDVTPTGSRTYPAETKKSALRPTVLMAEHVHLLTNEPAVGTLATFLQIFKQLTSRELKSPDQKQIW